MVSKLVRRLVRALGVRLFQRLGRDYITGMPIERLDGLERLGAEYGGWVVPTSMLRTDSVVYCVGCGEDISFDLTVIERFGCEVFGFDPTPRAIQFVKRVASENAKYHFEAVGLWNEQATLPLYAPKDPKHVSHSLVNLQGTSTFVEVPVERLSHIMARNGHRSLELLKLDIEGAEYKVLESVILDAIPIRIICVEFDEFHHPMDGGYRRRIRDSVKQLQAAGYSIVDAYGGNYTFVQLPGQSR